MVQPLSLDQDQSSPPKWWIQYFHPTPNPRSISSRIPDRDLGKAIAIPLVVMFLTLTGGLFWIISSEQYVDRVMAEARERAARRGQLEAFESVENMTRNAMQNPAARAWVSVQTGWIALRSFLLFMVLAWVLLSTITGTWRAAIPFAAVFCVSTGIFSAGAILYAAIRYLFGGELVFLAPVQLLDSFDWSNPLHLLSTRADLFFIWFLSVTSVRSAVLYREKIFVVGAILLGAWLILFSVSYLLDQPYYFLP